MEKLKVLVEKQRDEIRAKDHELTGRNEDVEAVSADATPGSHLATRCACLRVASLSLSLSPLQLQMQQARLMRVNQDLRHRVGAMEARGKALIQQKADLEAAAQAQQQELGTLRQEVTRLRKELRGWELEREVADVIRPPETPATASSGTEVTE